MQVRASAGGSVDLYRSGTSLIMRNNLNELTIQNFNGATAGSVGSGQIEKLQYFIGETATPLEFSLGILCKSHIFESAYQCNQVLICIDRVNCFLNFCILVTGLSAKQARYDGRSV